MRMKFIVVPKDGKAMVALDSELSFSFFLLSFEFFV